MAKTTKVHQKPTKRPNLPNVNKQSKMFTLFDTPNKNLNRSRTTQEGTQGLWDYPQPTLDAPRDPKQHRKPPKSNLFIKHLRKATQTSKKYPTNQKKSEG